MQQHVLDSILRSHNADVLRDLVTSALTLSGASRAVLIADKQNIVSTGSIAWTEDLSGWKAIACESKTCNLNLAFSPDQTDLNKHAQTLQVLAQQLGKLLDAYHEQTLLQIDNKRLRQAMTASGTGVWRLDVGTGVFEGDAIVAGLFGMAAPSIRRDFDTVVDLIDERERAGLLYGIGRGTNLDQRQRQIFQIRASGRWIQEIFERDASVGDRIGFVGVMHDHSAQREAELEVKMHHDQLEALVKNLRKSNRIDPLTGLSNRTAFNETMQAWTVSARAKGEWISLLMIDIDHFKTYNDQFGHDQGDIALKRVAQAIEQSVRGKDLPARFGGEEFCYLTLSEPELAEKIAERIRHAVEQVSWPLRSVTVSVGVCSLQGGEIDSTVLFKSADEALYAAKAAGRNRCVVANS